MSPGGAYLGTGLSRWNFPKIVFAMTDYTVSDALSDEQVEVISVIYNIEGCL